MQGLTSLRRPEQVAKLRGLSVAQVLGLEKNGKKTSDSAEGEGQAAEGGSAGASGEAAVDAEVPAATPEPEPAGDGAEGEASGGGTGSVA